MNKFVGLISLFLQRIKPSPDYATIKKDIKKYPKVHKNDGPLVLCQVVEDYVFTHRFIHFLSAYKELKNQSPRIGWIIIRKHLCGNSLRSKIRYTILNNVFTDHIWTSLYKSIGGKVVFKLDEASRHKQLAAHWANTQKDTLRSKDDLLKIQIENIVVGDLIYDTHLRFKPAPTINIQDPFLYELLIWCRDLYQRISEYLDENQVTSLVTSYTSYIHHGLFARIALERGIQVFALGAINQLVVQPTKDFPFHKRNFHKYKHYFNSIVEKTQALKSGIEIIEKRTQGMIDPATSYMAKSAYQVSSSTLPIFAKSNVRRAVVMGHDFYDSPHIYGDMLFPDFYEWITFIFTEAKYSSYQFYYKPHPNGLPENDSINAQLAHDFPHIIFIDKSVSNNSLVKEGFDIAFSVYGTVIHELAYLGVPVISCGANPHQVYSFNLSAKSKDELREYIIGIKSITIDSSDVPEFCYVHNYRHLDDSLLLFPFDISKNATEHFRFENLTSRIDSMKKNIQRVNSL